MCGCGDFIVTRQKQKKQWKPVPWVLVLPLCQGAPRPGAGAAREGCKAQLGNGIFLCSPHLLAPYWNLRVFLRRRQVLNGLKRCPCHNSLLPTSCWGQAGMDGEPGSGHFTPWEHPQGQIPSSSQPGRSPQPGASRWHSAPVPPAPCLGGDANKAEANTKAFGKLFSFWLRGKKQKLC